MKRRDFFKTSLAASAAITCSATAVSAAEGSASGREYYELRAYRLKTEASHELLDSYLEKALVPALNRLGVKPVGIFAEQEPKDGEKTWVLVPYPSLDAFAAVTAKLASDSDYQRAGAEY